MNGQNAAPLYKFLKSSKGGFLGDSIKWNFSKFLVDKEGNVVDRFAPTTSPLSIEVRKPACAITNSFKLMNSLTFSAEKFSYILLSLFCRRK